MPKKRNLKRTFTAFFTRKKINPQKINASGEEGFVSEESEEKPSRVSFEQRFCCLPSWQHNFHNKQPILTLDSSQVASASAYSDVKSLQSLDTSDKSSESQSPSLPTPLHDCSSSVCSFHSFIVVLFLFIG